jgi:hypothetical protein
MKRPIAQNEPAIPQSKGLWLLDHNVDLASAGYSAAADCEAAGRA